MTSRHLSLNEERFAEGVIQEIMDFFFRDTLGHGDCYNCGHLTHYQHGTTTGDGDLICPACSVELGLCIWCGSEDPEGNTVEISVKASDDYSFTLWECLECSPSYS